MFMQRAMSAAASMVAALLLAGAATGGQALSAGPGHNVAVSGAANSIVLVQQAGPAPQAVAPPWSEAQVNNALDEISRLPSLRGYDAESLFGRIGYRHSIAASDWNVLPFREQIEIAYHEASAVDPSNADRFMRAVTFELEKSYESVRFDPALSRFFAQGPWGGLQVEPIAFSPIQGSPRSSLPADITGALDALARYVSEGHGALSRAAVVERFFDLRGRERAQVLQHNDTRRALAAAMALAAIPPSQWERVRNLTMEVLRGYESAITDPGVERTLTVLAQISGQEFRSLSERTIPVLSFRDFGDPGLQSSTPAPPDRGGGGGRGQATRSEAAPGSEARQSEVARRLGDLTRGWYGPSGTASFGDAAGRRAGPGGVMFGAPVRNPPGLSVPLSAWIDGPRECPASPPQRSSTASVVQTLSRIHIRTEDGRLLNYGPITCDEALVAYRILFDRFPGAESWRAGAAVPIIAIAGSTLYLPAHPSDASRVGRWSEVTLHPALVDTDLGWSFLMVDALPNRRALLERTVGSPEPVRVWLDWLHSAEWRLLRWLDAPAQLASDDSGNVVVTRADGAETALVFGVFGMDDAWREFSGFAAAAPHLRARSRDFLRVESFARTFAVMRWLAQNNVRWFNVRDQRLVYSDFTPRAIISGLDGGWIATASYLEPREQVLDGCRKLAQNWGESLDSPRRLPEQVRGVVIELAKQCKASGRFRL
jgi:hypothetical protein